MRAHGSRRRARSHRPINAAVMMPAARNKRPPAGPPTAVETAGAATDRQAKRQPVRRDRYRRRATAAWLSWRAVAVAEVGVSCFPSPTSTSPSTTSALQSAERKVDIGHRMRLPGHDGTIPRARALCRKAGVRISAAPSSSSLVLAPRRESPACSRRTTAPRRGCRTTGQQRDLLCRGHNTAGASRRRCPNFGDLPHKNEGWIAKVRLVRP